MNEEMSEFTFVVESMTVEAGRIIPSPALAEAVIGGIAQIIAERDALRAERDRLRNINQTYEAENRVQRAERDAAQAEAARYKALWESVPRDAIRTAAAFALVDPYFAGGPPDPIEFQVRIVEGWLADHAPEPQDKEPQP